MNTSAAPKRSIMPGLFLILLGTYLLAQKLHWIDLGWLHIYPILILFAAARSYKNYYQFKRSNSLFNFVFLSLVGLFFLIRNFELIPFWPIETAWPIFLVSAGFGFLALFFRHTRSGFDLAFGSTLVLLGMTIFLNNLALIRIQFLADLWPIIFIIIGIALIRNSLKPAAETDETKPHSS